MGFPSENRIITYGLSDLKLAILNKWKAAHGANAILKLREEMSLRGEDGWIGVAELRDILAIDGNETAVATYVKQMATMDKTRAQILKVIESLRPSVPNARLAVALAKWPSLDAAWAEAEGIP